MNKNKEYTAQYVTSLTSACESDDGYSEDVLTFDELATSYKELYAKSTEVCKQVEKQKRLIKELKIEKKEYLATIESLNDEINMLNSKMDQMSKSVRMLN